MEHLSEIASPRFDETYTYLKTGGEFSIKGGIEAGLDKLLVD